MPYSPPASGQLSMQITRCLLILCRLLVDYLSIFISLPFGYFIFKHIRPILLGTLTLIKSIHFKRMSMLYTPIISSLTALSNVFWVRLDPSTCLAVIGGISGTQKMALIYRQLFINLRPNNGSYQLTPTSKVVEHQTNYHPTNFHEPVS